MVNAWQKVRHRTDYRLIFIIEFPKALLLHTEWNIADIAYALGFDYTTYFNNFFKKITGTNPKSLRVQEV